VSLALARSHKWCLRALLHKKAPIPLNSPTGVSVSELGDTPSVKSDTNCVNAGEVLLAKSGLVEVNTATMEWVPALNELVEYFAVPFHPNRNSPFRFVFRRPKRTPSL